MIKLFYENTSFEVFMQPTSKFKMYETIVSLLAGNIQLTPVMKIRFKIFEIICKLQKIMPLAPRLDFSDSV